MIRRRAWPGPPLAPGWWRNPSGLGQEGASSSMRSTPEWIHPRSVFVLPECAEIYGDDAIFVDSTKISSLGCFSSGAGLLWPVTVL
eukprot:9141732-Pyramimonas_sp.AAC.1